MLRLGGIAIACAAGVLVFAPAATAVVPQGNLVQNAGAEAGQGATDSVSQPPVPGWQVTGTFTAVQYGTSGFPAVADGSRVGGDKNFFAGGPSAPTSTASQTIDVSGAAPEIDGGNLGFTLSAFIGGFSTQGDNASVGAIFLDGSGTALAGHTIGPVTPAQRQNQTILLPQSTSGTVPSGTRTIQILITATRTDGQYNDGYADNVDLTLGPPPAQPVFAKSVEVTPVSGTVLVQVPGSKKFVALASARTIPTGSIVDARHGRVRIQAADGKGGFSFADFYQGEFKLLQPAKEKGITDLDLFGGSFKSCGRGGIAAGKKTKSVRHLWGQGSGKFRTVGRFASATVRGTTWFTDDECGGTLVRVTSGEVTVRDIPKKRNVVVTAPQRYFAAAKKR